MVLPGALSHACPSMAISIKASKPKLCTDDLSDCSASVWLLHLLQHHVSHGNHEGSHSHLSASKSHEAPVQEHRWDLWGLTYMAIFGFGLGTNQTSWAIFFFLHPSKPTTPLRIKANFSLLFIHRYWMVRVCVLKLTSGI